MQDFIRALQLVQLNRVAFARDGLAIEAVAKAFCQEAFDLIHQHYGIDIARRFMCDVANLVLDRDVGCSPHTPCLQDLSISVH